MIIFSAREQKKINANERSESERLPKINEKKKRRKEEKKKNDQLI